MEEIKEFTDEQRKILEKYARMSFANLRRNIIQDLVNNKNESVIYKKYPKDKVVGMLEQPQKHEKEIRELSNYLYIASSHYRRLVDYFSSILLYNYTVIPTNIPEKITKKKFKQTYMYLIKECEKYNLRHEATKAIKVTVRDGVFYGICYESEDSFYIKPVDSKYAQISSIEDGTYVFEFDLNYFNGKKELLSMYGTEFVNAYDRYKGNKDKGIKADKTQRWYEPKNGICIKADESDPYHSFPVFSGLLLSIFDIEDYKMLHKAKTENDNYKALGLQIPTDDDGVPLLEFEKNEQYFNHIVDNIANDGIGVFMSPFKVSDFSFASTASSDKNEIITSEEEFWMASGVSSLIFGSAKATSSSSLKLSVKPDEQIAFSMLMQFQRYFNKKIKKKNLEYQFKIEFLSQSIFNSDEFVNRYSKAAQYGMPVKIQYGASLGMSPSDLVGMTYLEEDILGLGTKTWKTPLVSSNTQSTSSSNEGGRPTAEESGTQIGDAGEATRNSDGNDR